MTALKNHGLTGALRFVSFFSGECGANKGYFVVENVLATSESKINEIIKSVGFHNRKAGYTLTPRSA
jgi:hypothetical protein